MIIDFSNPLLYNEKYISLLKNKKRYIFCVWSWWSWKSKFQAQKEIIKSFEKWNRCLCVRKVKDTIKESMFAELCWVINDWELLEYFTVTKSPMWIINNFTWSDFVFRWMDDPEKVKSIKWVTRVWIEEATELDKKDFDQIDLRLRWEKELQITCTLNPIDENHWINQDFYIHWSSHDVEILHTTYLDNRFVWEKYQKVMDRLKIQNFKMYQIYALWLWWRALEGLIYEYETIVSIPEEAKFLWYWLDFWFTHPACLVWIYEWNGWVIINEMFHKSWMINNDIVNFLKENNVNSNDVIYWDNSRPEAIEEIYRAWFNCKPCNKWKDSVINWINLMKGLKLYITSKSWWVIKDFNNYIWATDKNWKPLNDTPVKMFDDGPDASRYCITEFFWNEETFFTWYF